MALPWNPNAPAVYGIEDAMIRHGRTRLSTFSKAFIQKLVSQATETVKYVVLPFPLPDAEMGELAGPDFKYEAMLDVYTSDPTQLEYTFTSFTPNAFTDRVGWTDQAAGTANLHLVVDESPDAPDYSNYIIDTTVGSTHKVDFQFGTAAWPAGRRVLDVRVRARVRGGDIGFQLTGASDKIKTGYTGVVGSTGYRTVSVNFGENDPSTGKPWTQAGIQAFDTTANEVRVSREDGSVGFFSPTIAALELQILWIPETRVAYGTSSFFWNLEPEFSFTMGTPAGATSWAKVAGTTYWLVWRRMRGEQNPYYVFDPFPAQDHFDVPWVEGIALGSNPVWPQSYVADTGVGGRVTSLGAPADRRAMYGISTDAVNGQPDVTFPTTGQPYGEVDAADLSLGAVRQRIVAPATASYGAVRLAFVPGPVGSEAVTTIRIRNASTLATVGGTATLTREQLTETGTLLGAGTPGEVWSVQVVLSAAAALVNGTAYFLEVSGGDMRPVYLDVPDGRAQNFYTAGAPSSFLTPDWIGQLSFGDDDARAIIEVGAPTQYESGATDLLFSIAQQPAALTGFTATVTEQQLTNPTPDLEDMPGGCPSVTALPVVQLSWTATALGSSFLRYEVQRFDQLRAVWDTIALLTSPTATTWFDPDARFGVAEFYRVRQIRTGEVPSAYSAGFTTATITAPGCGLFLTVAEDQELNLAALDVYGSNSSPERDFTFLDEKVLVPMHGRDYQVAFQPLETRGAAFSRTILLNAITALPAPSFDAFDVVRTLARAPVSAVCVRDHEGNRWYCAMVVPSGKLRQPGEFAYVEVAFTEVGAGPVPYEGQGQQLGGS